MRPALRLVRRAPRSTASRALSSTAPRRSHLNPGIPTTPLGLPVTPAPSPIPTIPSAPLDRAQLHKLCSLAALNPPPEGSDAEAKLLAELGELVGLMDLVGSVQLEGDVGSLLSEGMGEFVMGEQQLQARDPVPEGEERGRELLEYATRRVGDFYGFRVDGDKDKA